MREERGHVKGNTVIDEPYTLWGSIAGDVTAVKGSKFYMRGAIYGDLTVLHKGRVHIFGNITGNLYVKDGAKVVHEGVIGGDVLNSGGRLFIYSNAKILGKVRTEEEGTTTYEGGETVTSEE